MYASDDPGEVRARFVTAWRRPTPATRQKADALGERRTACSLPTEQAGRTDDAIKRCRRESMAPSSHLGLDAAAGLLKSRPIHVARCSSTRSDDRATLAAQRSRACR